MQTLAQKKSIVSYIVAALLAITGIILIALQNKPVGFSLLLLLALTILLLPSQIKKHWLLIIFSVFILGIIPINTNVDIDHMLLMGVALSAAIAVPYIFTTYVYKSGVIKYTWHHGRKWYKHEIFYILLTALIAYIVLPFYLSTTGAYLNWSVEPGINNLIKLFIGTNALGIWDELFFIATILALLRLGLTFWFANITQAVLFTCFLYELGFTGWAPLIIYPFALLQGLIYMKTESLLYVITIHLTLDLILYLALIDAHHPNWLPIFITG